MKMNKIRLLALAGLLLTPVCLAGADLEFMDAVEELERRLDTPRVRIPLFGLVKAVAYPVYRPLGVKNFDMAIFDGVRRPLPADADPFRKLGPGWRPILRVRDRRGDSVTIYGRDENDWVRMMMLVLDRKDAVMMHFKMRPSALMIYLSKVARHDH
jgi:hypothetical protein